MALRVGALALGAALAFALAVALLGRSTEDVRDTVDGAGAWAPVLYVVLVTVLTCAFFPFPLMAAAGGLVFGIAEGTALSVLGGSIGALLAFVLARTVAGDAIAGWPGSGSSACNWPWRSGASSPCSTPASSPECRVTSPTTPSA